MDSLFIAGFYQRQVRHLEKQQKHNPNDDYGFCGFCMKRIAFEPVGAPPCACGGKEGVGQGKEVDDCCENNGRLGEDESEGSHGGNKVQN